MKNRLLEIPKTRLLKKILGFDEIYSIAYRQKNSIGLLGDQLDKEPFKLVENTSRCWSADPLVFSYKDKEYLFVEEYDRGCFKGHISVSEIDNEKFVGEFKKIIQEKFHMSFPMVFEWNDDIYMIPETSEDHSIRVYIAEEFPYRWKCIERFVTEGKYVDTVVIGKKRETVSLLTSKINPDNPLEVMFQKLCLKKNKNGLDLIWDSEFNINQNFNYFDRVAGNVISIDESNFIPTQYSSVIDYGVGIVVKKLEKSCSRSVKNINKGMVSLKEVKKENILGVHTYSCSKKYEIIDVRYLKFSPQYQYKKLFR